MATFGETHVVDVPLGDKVKGRKLEMKDPQKKVRTVLEEFKSGTLRSSSGEKVTSREQAIAIAMSEAGLSKNELSEDQSGELSELLRYVLEDQEQETVDIPDVVILGTGRFQGVGENAKEPYTEADLQEIADTHSQLEAEGKWIPRLSISHEEIRDVPDKSNLAQYLAFGMVKNIRKVGRLLVADFKNVPKRVAGFINSGMLPSRSSEVWEKVKPEFLGLKTMDGKVLGNVIRRVSLLGHEPPALWEIEGIVNKYELSEDLTDLEVKVYKYSEGEVDMSKGNKLPEDFSREVCLGEIKKYMMDMKYMMDESLMEMSDEDLFHYKSKLHDEFHRRQHVRAGDTHFGMGSDKEYMEHGKKPVQMMMEMEKNGMTKKYEQKPEEANPSNAPALSQADVDAQIAEALKKYKLEAQEEAKAEMAAKFEAQEKQLADMKVGLVKFQLNAQRLEHEKAVDALIKQNKVAPFERENTLAFMERLAEVPEVKKYSLGKDEKEGSMLSHYMDLLKSRKEHKSYSVEEVAESHDGLRVDANVLNSYGVDNVEADMAMEDLRIKKYAQDNNVSYAEAFDAVTGTKSFGSLF